MLKTFIFLLFLVLSTQLCAQNAADSINIKDALWVVEKLEKGIIWKYYHFKNLSLFKANQSINVIEVSTKIRRYDWALVTADSLKKQDKSRGELRLTSEMAMQHGALIGINGGFFDVKNGGSVDFFKTQGYITDTTRAKKGTKAQFHGQNAVVLHKNKIEIVKGTDRVGWEYELPYNSVMLSGPLLVWQGKEEILPKSAFNDNRHPRSCVCITDKKKVLLIAVDGRSADSYGMNLSELTFLAKQLGCHTALNLDGGGSTTLWIQQKGVVNYPSDNKKFDHEGERKVSNAILLIPRK